MPPRAPDRPLFLRDPESRLVAGVAGGLAARIGVERVVVRAALGLLALAGGAGLVLYAALWALSAEPGPEDVLVRRPVTPRHTIGCVLVTIGGVLLLQRSGLVLAPGVIIPIGFAAAGVAVVWARSDDDERARAARDPVQALLVGRRSLLRLAVGCALLLVGIVLPFAHAHAFSSTKSGTLAAMASGAGLLVLLGPWSVRLYRQLAEERRRRIRSDERAELSAHLHDSVLQTLALIQRSDAPADVIALARRQERELRAWMLGRSEVGESDLRGALDVVVDRVEAQYDVTVETVVVGDCETDERVEALLAAASEAIVNAARHAGVRSVSVYVEVLSNELVAYVRDEGNGFDRGAVAPDRRGIADSIEGRIRRAGGRAAVRSTEGRGTEVELHVPRTSS